jgi:DNA-binding Lrp family transcriptional regulator
MELDRFDIQILRRLQADSRTAAEAIGAEIGLSATAVQRRIRRLRSDGAIREEVAHLSTDVLPSFVMLVVEVKLKRGLKSNLDAFRRKVVPLDEVQQCFYVTGESDFVLVLVMPSMQAYERFTERVFFENDNIEKFRSTVVIEAAKQGLTLPVAAANPQAA